MDADLTRWLESLVAERGASPHTLRAYEGDLSLLSHFLAGRGRALRHTTLADLRGWLATSQAPDGHAWTSSTMSRRVAAARTFFR